MNLRTIHLTALLLGLALLNVGCVGVFVPVPSAGKQSLSGRVRSASDTRFIKPGLTTRREVVEELGTGFRATSDRRAISYSWEQKGGDVYGAMMVGTTFFSGAGAGVKHDAWTYWRAVFIEFDSEGIVQHVSRVRLSSSKSVDTQLQEWVQANRRKSPKTSKPSLNNAKT